MLMIIVYLFVSYAHINLCHFFSSSWCQGLAATSACGSSWTFLFTFLDDYDLFPVVLSFYPEGLPELVFVVQSVWLSYFPWSSVEAVVRGYVKLLVVGSGGGGCRWLVVDGSHSRRDTALLLCWSGIVGVGRVRRSFLGRGWLGRW